MFGGRIIWKAKWFASVLAKTGKNELDQTVRKAVEGGSETRPAGESPTLPCQTASQLFVYFLSRVQ